MLGSFASLVDLFIWSNRERRFRIRFVDGEYVMRAVVAGQDFGEPPHAVGSIVERLSGAEKITPAVDLLFALDDVLEVVDVATGEIIFRAA